MEALDMLANNLANSTTSGYKLDREFYSLFDGTEDATTEGQSMTKLPSIQSQWTDFTQGTLQTTGNPLDLSLSGKGFFVVNGPNGPLYTRNGSFQLSQTGVLQTTEGYPVSGVGGTTIKTQSQGQIKVSADGTVEQDGQTLGQLQLADFQNRSLLVKEGSSYFKSSGDANKPVPPGDTTVSQGKIEASNVQPAELAVRLVGLSRQFEMLQKAITLTSDMNKQALAEVARVGGA